MATTSNPGGQKPATRKSTTTRKSASGSRSTTRKSTATTRTTARKTTSRTTSTQPKTRVEQAQQIAERAVLVPVGASILARENLVSTVKGLATKYRTRDSVERELKRYERRGATARNRFERQVRRTRTKFERSVKQNRRRFERELGSVRKDLGKQSETLSSRVEKLVSDATDRLGSAA
jgi:hypothetical protein